MIAYDGFDAVTEGLQSLQQFNELVAARHHAGYCWRRRMNGWILKKGTWFMSELGNTGRFGVLPGSGFQSILLPEIASLETFRTDFPDTRPYIEGVFLDIPPAGAVCARCGTAWTMDNCHLARHHEVSSETLWITDPSYVGRRYHQIPRASIEPDGVLVRIKPTTLIIKNRDGAVMTSEGELTYDYELDPTDLLPFSLVRFEHVDACC